MLIEFIIIGIFSAIAASAIANDCRPKIKPTYYITAVPFNRYQRGFIPTSNGIYLPETYVMSQEAYSQISTSNTPPPYSSENSTLTENPEVTAIPVVSSDNENNTVNAIPVVSSNNDNHNVPEIPIDNISSQNQL